MPDPLYTDVCDGTITASSLTADQLCFLKKKLSLAEWRVIFALLLKAAASGGTTPTAGNVAPTMASTSTSGSTAAGLMEVSIANIGGVDGDIEGVTFPADASVTYRGYYDEFTGVMSRLAAIDYDATGTTFLISTIP